MYKSLLTSKINQIKTTKLGLKRISKNLNIEENQCITLCLNTIKNASNIYKKGKNFYCEKDNICITINSSSYTIITAHKKN